jgi:hypothetical protein
MSEQLKYCQDRFGNPEYHEWLPKTTLAKRSDKCHPDDPTPDTQVVTEVFCRWCLKTKELPDA